MSIKSLFAKLLIGIVPFLSGCSNLPIEVPIDLSKDGDTVEFEAVITKADNYDFMLHFYTPKRENNPTTYKEEYNALYDFVGHGYNIGSQIIPIRVMIYKITKNDKELISDKTYDTKNQDGLAFKDTGDFLFRWITFRDFEKGKYFIRVENIKGFEFMKNKHSAVSLLKYKQKV
jgi:hypothetical protein